MFGTDPAQNGAALVGRLVIEVHHQRGPDASHLPPLKDQPLVRHAGGMAGVHPHMADASGERPSIMFWRVRSHSEILEQMSEQAGGSRLAGRAAS